MTLQEYGDRAVTTNVYQTTGDVKADDPSFVANMLGLVGEAGEVAEKVKKIIRDQNGEFTDENRAELIKEIGDVLWYVNVLSRYLGSDLEAVAELNLAKLADRKARGVIQSQGDNR